MHKIDTTDDWLYRISPTPNLIMIREHAEEWIDSRRYSLDHSLNYVGEGGAMEIQFDDEKVLVESNQYYIIPPGRWHSRRVFGSGTFQRRLLYFDWEYCPLAERRWATFYSGEDKEPLRRVKSAPEYVPKEPMRGRVTDPERFCELFQRALNLYSGGQPEKTGALRARGAVLDLLVWLFSTTKSAPGARGDAESIRDARDILRDLAMKPFSQASSIRELFEGRGLGYDHHARLFRQVHGLTPLQYVNQIRVDRAKRLLMDSTMSVKEIAENLGFRDSPYLVRLFKKTTGASPGEFRARAKSSDSPSVTSVSTKGIPSDAQ